LTTLTATTNAWATDYFIAPNGDDASSGTSSGTPWKSFAFAIPELQPGDTLILKDGTYSPASTELPTIDCHEDANNGAQSNPITIKAENERQAFLQDDGHHAAFWADSSLIS